MYDLSIVIPAYNEERRIKETTLDIIRYLQSRNIHAEVIIVNDGSKDKTAEIVDQLSEEYECVRCIHLSQNQGKGYAVKEGVLASWGKYIFFSDADLSVPIEEMDKLLSPLERGYDIAIGSRRLSESDVIIPQPWHRRFSGKAFSFLVRLLLVQGIKDTQCGFKAFRKDVAHIIFSQQRIKRFSFDVEVLYLARKYGFKVKEVPIRWIDSPYTTLKFARDSVKMFIDLFIIRLNDILGRYK